MQKYYDTVFGQGSNAVLPVANASVTVLTSPAGAVATIYSDNGVTITPNPLTTAADGSFSFYAANGRYTLAVSYFGVSKTLVDIVLEDDPANGQSQVITGGSIDNTPIGQTTPAIGSFTSLSANGTLAGFPGRLIGRSVFTSSGTYAPSSAFVTQIIVEAQAPGGGGAGCPATGASQSAIGGGGGAGAYARVYFNSGFSSVAVTIPSGGAGGAAGANGGVAGSTVTFGTLISCPGGNGGSSLAVASAATIVPVAPMTAAPTISGGTTLLSIPGSPSILGLVLTPGSVSFSGQGGQSLFGAPGNGRTGGGAGIAATGFGSGGSGGNQPVASSAAQAGGSGSPGIIIVYEYS